MKWFLKLSILTLLIQLNGAAVNVIPSTIFTQYGGSYTAMLVDDKKTIIPKKCYLNDFEVTYEIDLETPGVPLHLHSNDIDAPLESKTNILTSLGSGICGFKLHNFDNNNYIKKWNISFEDKYGYIHDKIVNVKLTDKKNENKDIYEYVIMGLGFDIECGNLDNSLNPRDLLNCQLYDPLGTLVMSKDYKNGRCSYRVVTSKITDFGQWKCILHLRGNISQTNVYYNIFEKEKVSVNVYQNETTTHVNIGCYTNNLGSYENANDYCEMIRPDGEIFALADGLSTDRYTTYGTKLIKGICGMEIKKPLEEFEKGLWRCAYKYSAATKAIGGFILLSSLNPPAPAQPNIPKQIIALENESFSVTCQVPYSSSYCYMRGPTGTIYPVENTLDPTLGICKFTKDKASLINDNGTWSCGFAKDNVQIDQVYKFDVIVLKNYGVKPEKKEVYFPIGSNAYLKCSTKGLGDYPIQYCRFQKHLGQTYNIYEEQISSNRINYYGRGFKYGDCGIEIKTASFSDSGIWRCMTRIGNNFLHPEIDSEIELQILHSTTTAQTDTNYYLN